jgi:hypothetical protein
VKKIKQASIYVLGLALTVALVPVSSYAESAAQETVTEARCALAETKIATRITALSTAQTDHNDKYTKISNKLTAFISTATTANYPNVSKITTARDDVTKAISAYNAQVTVYQDALQTAQTTTCGNNGGEFVKALKTARTELVTLRTDSLAVKTAIVKEAVPALHDYATWLKTNSTTAKGNQ